MDLADLSRWELLLLHDAVSWELFRRSWWWLVLMGVAVASFVEFGVLRRGRGRA